MESPLNVVVCAPILGTNLDPVRAVGPSVNVIDGNAIFGAYNRARLEKDQAAIESTDKQMRDLLAQADVLCMMHPMLPTAAALAPNMRWFHHTQAGVSNLWPCDVWQREDIVMTSGRGTMRPTAMAEYCIAAAMMFARSLHDGMLDKAGGQLDRSHHDPRRIEGSTMGIVGLGGIGREVARLSKALGMRVIATRRSATVPQEDVDGVDLLLPASDLHRLAAESDFIAVCVQLTQDTVRLLNGTFFDALEKRPVLVNVSRGEVVDEDAMLAALDSGKLWGAVLDVYEGELDRKPPRPELMSHPSIILTPHNSTGGATSETRVMDLFCENLRRFVKGEDLLNVVDRARGY
ncbi:MAG TPA: D-2-hydroxyacid dehydrogenase [Dehalococcoidia bacterium]|nr:D-2-hydroxyacid dehydrogenase [Dehalococcoidia bacterium]